MHGNPTRLSRMRHELERGFTQIKVCERSAGAGEF